MGHSFRHHVTGVGERQCVGDFLNFSGKLGFSFRCFRSKNWKSLGLGFHPFFPSDPAASRFLLLDPTCPTIWVSIIDGSSLSWTLWPFCYWNFSARPWALQERNCGKVTGQTSLDKGRTARASFAFSAGQSLGCAEGSLGCFVCGSSSSGHCGHSAFAWREAVEIELCRCETLLFRLAPCKALGEGVLQQRNPLRSQRLGSCIRLHRTSHLLLTSQRGQVYSTGWQYSQIRSASNNARRGRTVDIGHAGTLVIRAQGIDLDHSNHRKSRSIRYFVSVWDIPHCGMVWNADEVSHCLQISQAEWRWRHGWTAEVPATHGSTPWSGSQQHVMIWTCLMLFTPRCG